MLILASAVAIGLMMAHCREPPIGYTGAGRTTTLPDLAGDSGGAAGLCAPDGVICHKDPDCCGDHTCNGYCQNCTGGSCRTPPGGTGLCAPDGIVFTLKQRLLLRQLLLGNGRMREPAREHLHSRRRRLLQRLPPPGTRRQLLQPLRKKRPAPCNTFTANLGCTGPELHADGVGTPLRAPRCDVFSRTNPPATPCCAGSCFYNEMLESICALPP